MNLDRSTSTSIGTGVKMEVEREIDMEMEMEVEPVMELVRRWGLRRKRNGDGDGRRNWKCSSDPTYSFPISSRTGSSPAKASRW